MRLWVVFVALACFGGMNYLDFYRRPECYDCNLLYGWPIPFWHIGGFGGSQGFYVKGLAIDLLLLTAVVVSVTPAASALLFLFDATSC